MQMCGPAGDAEHGPGGKLAQPSRFSAALLSSRLLGFPHLDPAGAPPPNRNEPSKQRQEVGMVQAPLQHLRPPRGLRG